MIFKKIHKITRKITLAIFTRQLFENWLIATLRYLLIKYGLVSDYIVVRCNNTVHRLCSSLYGFIVNNYYDRNIVDFRCSEVITFRFADVPLKIIPPCFVEFDYMGRSVRFFDPFPFLYDILFENFYGGAYDDLDVSGRVVVDIGAGVGDTAILFLLRGASRVIGLEPYPKLFDLARINIRINGFEDRVELLNAALATSNGYAYAPEEETREYTLFRSAPRGRLIIKTVTLKSIAEGYNIVDGGSITIRVG